MEPKSGFELQQHAVDVPAQYRAGYTSDNEHNVDHDIHDGIHTGNSADAFDMRRMGRKQELRRNFKSISILGLAAVTMATWLALLVGSLFSLTNGGLAGTIWVYLGSWICTMTLVSSLAEMASMAPTSGGQYHWVSEFAPASQQAFLSYVVGWLAALGWQAIIAGGAFSTAALLLQLISFNNPSYVPENWHITLLMIGVAVFAAVFNTVGVRQLPMIEGVILFVHIFGFFAIIITLWAMAPKVPASEVFGSFSDNGGWGSIGTACFVGTIAATGSFAGSDAPAHLAEEVKDASITVPRMMFATIPLNGAMGFVMIITYVFCITDLSAIIQSKSAFVYVDVFYAATASKAGTTALVCLTLVLTACVTLNSLAAASRQAWALSRDGGLPLSGWFQKIITIGTPVPINAILFSLSIVVVLAMINLGSSTAFNSIIALTNSAFAFSYALSVGCVLYRRIRGPALPYARWSLGKFGIPINMLAIAYVITAATASFFPVTALVEPSTMNWSIVMFAGVFFIATIDYLVRGRKKYVPPVMRVYKE